MNTTRVVRNLSAAAVAGIAGIASYSHMRQLALDHGQAELIAALLPLSVDGMLIVATVAMHDDKTQGRPRRPAALFAFAAGVVASVTANVLAADPELVARTISAWPAVALLLVVEILAGRRLTRHHSKTTDAPVSVISRTTGSRTDVQADKPQPAPGGKTRRTRAAKPNAASRVLAAVQANPGATQAQLAKAAGASDRTVRRVLSGQTTGGPAKADGTICPLWTLAALTPWSMCTSLRRG